MKELVFMGGKEIGYHCLAYLLEKKEELGVRVTAALQSGRMLFEDKLDMNSLCEKHGVPVVESLQDFQDQPDCDLILSVQYDQILKAEHISKARQLAVNLHMAPLPEYRGCNQFSFAILDKATEFGTTLHRLEEEIDAGAILFEDRFPIPEEIFVKDLYAMTYEKSLQLFKNHIKEIIQGDYPLKEQSSFEKERGTSYHHRGEMEEIRKIYKKWSIEQQKRYFRATYFPPFDPPCLVEDEDTRPVSMDWYNKLA